MLRCNHDAPPPLRCSELATMAPPHPCIVLVFLIPIVYTCAVFTLRSHYLSAKTLVFSAPQVQAGMPAFTLAQRITAVLRNGFTLLGVGMASSFIGVGITNTLLGLRAMMDPTFTPANKPQNVLATSAAYGTYMSTSSNLRYVPRQGCPGLRHPKNLN